MKHYSYLLFIALATFGLYGCTEEAREPQPEPGGSIRLEFDNIVGDKNLVLDGVTYQTPSGEDFTVSTLNYFVSNFVFHRAGGERYVVPQDSSYFLVKESEKSSQFITFRNVPLGNYTEVEFMVGVDSLRSTSPIDKRTGVLDPVEGHGPDNMYWSWNSGYVFVKLEGASSKAGTANSKFYYHIGLYGGDEKPTVNNTRNVRIKFDHHMVTVDGVKTPEVHFFADVLKFFSGPGTDLKIAEFPTIMGALESESQKVADNYAGMFSFDHVH